MKVTIRSSRLYVNISGLPSYNMGSQAEFDEGVKVLLTDKQQQAFTDNTNTRVSQRRIRAFNRWYLERRRTHV